MMLKRVMALDVGEKRIGLAVGGSDVKIAVPVGIVENNENVVAELGKIIQSKKVDLIVVGLPRNSAGQETQQSQFVRDFSKKLTDFNLPVVFQDESLTSVEAELSIGVVNKNDRKKGLVDSEAAAIILTDYLEANFGK